MPNILNPFVDPDLTSDRQYTEWIARKKTTLRRPLLDCGCQNRGEVSFHLWCDRLACEMHAEDPHDCSKFKGKSQDGVEETAQPFVIRRRSPEARRAYLADQLRQAVAAGRSPDFVIGLALLVEEAEESQGSAPICRGCRQFRALGDRSLCAYCSTAQPCGNA